MDNKFQCVGSVSNTHASREFEETARLFFAMGIVLQLESRVPVSYKIKKVPIRKCLGS